MPSSSRLELIISSRQAEQSLNRMGKRLNEVDRAGGDAAGSMTTMQRRLAGVERFATVAGGAIMGLSAGAGVFTAIARSASQRSTTYHAWLTPTSRIFSAYPSPRVLMVWNKTS